MISRCPRAFEVEALRDGRLSGAERARFEAHAAGCSACKREAATLEALAKSLRVSEEPHTDELHVRRERTRLLAAFDGRLTPPPTRRARAWWGAAAALALVGGLSAFYLLTKPPAPPLALHPATVEVRADTNARWSRSTEAQREVVALESGALFIRVEPGSARRLLVKLPDGELEDIGTVFSVSAAAGHTTRVTVQEGSVVLRLDGRAPIALGAGEAWVPPPVVAAPSLPAPAATATFRAAPRSSPKIAPSAEPPSDAAAEFRAAMAAFNQGDTARAAELFTAFLGQFPRDSRAEDAAYLRTLAHQRRGDVAATERAAREYLARYPRGFRRAEVETLLGAGGT